MPKGTSALNERCGTPVNSPLSPPLLQLLNIPQAKIATKKYICFIF
jgi:hypothetical protein